MAQWQKILAILAFAAAARHVFVAPANQPPTSSAVLTHVVHRPQLSTVGDEQRHTIRILVPAGKAVLLASLSLSGARQPVVLTWREQFAEPNLKAQSSEHENVHPGWHAPVNRRLPQPRLKAKVASSLSQFEDLPHASVQKTGRSLIPTNPRQRRFVVPLFTGQLVHDRHVLATEIARGQRVSVYLVEGDAAAFAPLDATTGNFKADQPVASVMYAQEAAEKLAAEIITRCEQRLLPFVEHQLGPVDDLDDDGNLTFVLTQLSVNGPDHPIEPPITGCVRPSDYLWHAFGHSDVSGSDWADSPFGHDDADHGGDIVYLDCQLPNGREMDAVLAHELAHAATFCLLNASAQADGELPGWLNEAIAHAIEQQVHPDSQNLAQRLAEFTARPHLFPIVIPDGSPHLSLRRGPARAAGCLFLNAVLQELPEQSLRRIVQAGRNGVNRLEQVSGRSFADLLQDWGLQLMAGSLRYPEVSLNPDQPQQLQLAGTALTWTTVAPADGVLQIEASASARLQITIVDPTSCRDLTPDVDSVAVGEPMPSVDFQ